MIGIHCIIDFNQITNYKNATSIKEDWHYIKSIYKTENISLEYSGYEGYPINIWDNEESVIVLEGMVYNKSDLETKQLINDIAQEKSKDEIINKVKNFTKECDGDYVIVILNKETQHFTAFNNFLGTVPLYYYFDNERFIITRNISFILENIQEILFYREAMSEYMAMGFSLGKRTLFQNIYKLTPAQAIFCKKTETCIKTEILTIIESDFSITDKFKNKQESLTYLKSVFLEGLKNRIDKVKDKEILNQLTGGFDSRAIFGGLNVFDKNFTNITHEYTQDESPVTKELTKITKEQKFIKNSFKLDLSLDNSKNVFKINALNNCFTIAACYNEEIYNRENLINGNTVVFGGFGGEYIRHPYFVPIGNVLNIKLYRLTQIRYKKLTNIIKGRNSNINLRLFLSSSLKPYSSIDKESLIKLLYNEYYISFINMAALDRSRLSCWHIHPFMNKDFILAVRNRIPLSWVGYNYFTDFIKLIDENLLKLPLFNSNINLESKFSLHKADFIMKTEYLLINLMAMFNTKRSKLNKSDEVYPLELLEEYYRKINHKDLFNIESIKKDFNLYNKNLKYRILTLMQYVYEIENQILSK